MPSKIIGWCGQAPNRVLTWVSVAGLPRCGGVIAFAIEVRQRVLDVPDVPVVAPATARAAALGSEDKTHTSVPGTHFGGPIREGAPTGPLWLQP
ncbi:hypothetical protein FMUBM48_30170 [Nocardia cyriacigeorgica]|nr:hypothetical protein FMUBM48_30170 [Nocardia cyriacigeorgica]